MPEPTTTPAHRPPGNLFTSDQRTSIAQLIGADQRPVSTELTMRLAEAVRDRREHDHPRWDDLFCSNLTSWLGERMGAVLRRLVDAEAETARLQRRVAELEANTSPAEHADRGEAVAAAPDSIRNGGAADE